MTAYPVRHIQKPPNAWLFAYRPMRGDQLVGAQIHASRSGISDGDDGPRTERWMFNTNNGSAAQGWGGSCDLIIFETGERVIVNPDYRHYDSTFSAGFGLTSFTWSCGWYYRQIEMAQGQTADAYTFAQIDSLAEYLVAEGVAPVRIPWLSQTLGTTPPPGICTHEDSENGRKLGKSDPGPMFPWAQLFERMAARSNTEEDDFMAALTDDEQREILAMARFWSAKVSWSGKDETRAEALMRACGELDADGAGNLFPLLNKAATKTFTGTLTGR